MSPMAKMPGVETLEFRRVHRNQVLVQVQPEFRNRPELDGQTEERQERIRVVPPFLLVGTGQRHRFELTARAMQRLHAGDMEVDLSLGHQFAHAVDTVLRGAKPVAVMHQRQALARRARD